MKKLAILVLALLAFGTQANASPQFGNKTVTIATIYDGRTTYTEVFQFVQDTHLDLADPTTRRQWCDRWQPSNINSAVFASRPATESAIKNMMQSLSRKHDMFLSSADTARQKAWLSATDTVRTTILRNNIALVKIPSFLPKTVDRETQIAIANCSKAKAIILDLRGNTGGLVTPALNVAATLIPEGLVYISKARVGDQIEETKRSLTTTQWVTVTSGSHPTVTEYAKRTQIAVAATVPMVVLVDRQTASAAELLTGALKQTRRAVIIGTRTYGKGTGNKLTFLNSNGRSLQITHEKLFPGGLDTDGAGILPDVAIDQPTSSPVDSQLDTAITQLTRLLPKEPTPKPVPAQESPAKPDSLKRPYGGSPYVRFY